MNVPALESRYSIISQFFFQHFLQLLSMKTGNGVSNEPQSILWYSTNRLVQRSNDLSIVNHFSFYGIKNSCTSDSSLLGTFPFPFNQIDKYSI